jgi:SAM-dependent methyltransferase
MGAVGRARGSDDFDENRSRSPGKHVPDMSRSLRAADGTPLDLDYFIEWRAGLWRRPLLWALGDLDRLQGARVLDYGCRYGKISCLFALLGAEVVGVDVDGAAIDRARHEAQKWNVSSGVTFLHYGGDAAELQPRRFDLIFTKSVLYWVQDLAPLLDRFRDLLADDGRVAFVENWRGSDLMMALRRRLLHRRWMRGTADFPGIRRAQLPLLAERFDRFEHRLFYRLVIAMRGQSRGPSGTYT